MLRFLTSGESHGQGLTALIEGLPAGLAVREEDVNRELARRQAGYGRGGRMKIEKDRAQVLSGIRFSKTTGAPVCIFIKNLDWENWGGVMAPFGPETDERSVTKPRPGHADLAGGLKYGHIDLRNILERSSARETAARVAAGALAKRFLNEFGIDVHSWVVSIGSVECEGLKGAPSKLSALAEKSEVRCPDKQKSIEMMKEIDAIKGRGDSAGGVFEVVVTGVPPGLGSHVQWDRKLDGRLARALMSVQAIKGVEIGAGFRGAHSAGSKAHDEISYTTKGSQGRWWPVLPRFTRRTNNAGGIEGGMSNGEPIVIRSAMKPIPTLYKPLKSVDIITKKPFKAGIERSDICAVPAASVVGEAAAAFELASAFIEKFGGDSIRETGRNYRGYLDDLKAY